MTKIENNEILPLPGDYATLLRSIAAEGYEFPRFLNFDSGAQHVLLRHDVDISVSHAHKLAIIENSLGVHSAFFFLLRSDFYNPFSSENTKMIKEIIELGHDVGLHIDLSVYNCTPDNIHHHVVEEARLLSQIIEAPVYLVSFHRPTTLMRNVAYEHIKLPGFVSLYEPNLFKDIGFISDSRGGWYHGHPLDHPAFKEKRAFQLLTHPIWWIEKDHENAVELLHSLSDASAANYLRKFREEFSIMRQN